MQNIFVALTVIVIAFCACQKEPAFLPVDKPTSAKAASDTVKAIVFDGILDPSEPLFDYDSLVYSPGTSGSVIKHYTKPGAFMWQEVLDYDTRGRVSHYAVNYPNANFRHCYFSYAANDSFPSAIIDSVMDSGDLFVDLLNRTATATSGANTTYSYHLNYSAPGNSYFELYNVKYTFNPAGRLVAAASDSFYLQRGELHTYTGDGLLDSTQTTAYAASLADSNTTKIVYTNYGNPLSSLGKLVYKNLYAFLSHTMGLYTYHFSLSGIYTGMFAQRLPQSATDFSADHRVSESYTYAYQFQGTAFKAMRILIYREGFAPSSSTVSVRIY